MKSFSVWTCVHCHKQSYLSKRDAKKAAITVDPRCRAYSCPVDKTVWHFGHLPTAVRMGDFDRHKLRQMRGQNP